MRNVWLSGHHRYSAPVVQDVDGNGADLIVGFRDGTIAHHTMTQATAV